MTGTVVHQVSLCPKYIIQCIHGPEYFGGIHVTFCKILRHFQRTLRGQTFHSPIKLSIWYSFWKKIMHLGYEKWYFSDGKIQQITVVSAINILIINFSLKSNLRSVFWRALYSRFVEIFWRLSENFRRVKISENPGFEV